MDFLNCQVARLIFLGVVACFGLIVHAYAITSSALDYFFACGLAFPIASVPHHQGNPLLTSEILVFYISKSGMRSQHFRPTDCRG